MKNSEILKKCIEIFYNCMGNSKISDTAFDVFFKNGQRLSLVFIYCRGYGISGKGFDKAYNLVESTIQYDGQTNLKPLKKKGTSKSDFQYDWSTPMQSVYNLLDNNKVDWDKTFNVWIDENSKFSLIKRLAMGLCMSVYDWIKFKKELLNFKNLENDNI